MIAKNLIALHFLVYLFIHVNCEKSCVIQGTNGVMFFGPLINAEEKEPLKVDQLKEFKEICPNLSDNDLACCDNDQLEYIKMLNYAYKTNNETCNRNYRDLYCMLHCKYDQKRYISVLNKTESYNEKDKFDLQVMDVKIDLNSTEKYYNSCVLSNARLKLNNMTVYDYFGRPKSSPYLFAVLNSMSTYMIDYHFYNRTSNETFHLVADAEREVFNVEPIVDTRELLPIEFK